jgi:hypothetical protein
LLSLRPCQKVEEKEHINVLSIVMLYRLHDINLLTSSSMNQILDVIGYCVRLLCLGLSFLSISPGTTNTLFMEKLQYYDLIIDMTSFSPERASRPALQLSEREPNGSSRRPSYRLSTISFTWSDVKMVCTPRFLVNPLCDKDGITYSGMNSTAFCNSMQPETARLVCRPRSGRTPGGCTKMRAWPVRGSGLVAAHGATTMA